MKQLTSVAGASRQAGEVLRSDKATSSQKKEAVKVLGTAIATESAKKVGESIYREAKKAARTPAAKKSIAAAAKKAAPAALAAARVVPIVAGVAATTYVGGKALTANRQREARRYADQQLALTKKRIKGLTAADAKVLWTQYYNFKLSQPVTNPYLGK